LHVACSGTLFHKSNHNNNQNNNTATKLHLINHKMSLAFRAFFLKFMNEWMVGLSRQLHDPHNHRRAFPEIPQQSGHLNSNYAGFSIESHASFSHSPLVRVARWQHSHAIRNNKMLIRHFCNWETKQILTEFLLASSSLQICGKTGSVMP